MSRFDFRLLVRGSLNPPCNLASSPWTVSRGCSRYSSSNHRPPSLPHSFHQTLKCLLTHMLWQHSVSLRMLNERTKLLPLTIHPQHRTQHYTPLKHPYILPPLPFSHQPYQLCSKFPSPGTQFLQPPPCRTFCQICIQSTCFLNRPHHTCRHSQLDPSLQRL